MKLPWAEAHSRFTLLFERLAIDVLQEATVRGATRILRISWEEAWHLIERALKRGLQAKAKPVPARLGVDEKAISKGARTITLVCDLDASTIEYVAEARRMESLDGYFLSFSAAQLEGIRAVAMDRWPPYIASTLRHVPYKGSGPAHIDLMGGQIPLMFDNIVALMPHVKAGKLRAIAVTSAKRNAMLPEVPTIAESGVAGFETVAWFGFVAAPGTPRDILQRLNAEVLKAMKLADVEKRLLDGGSELVGGTPEAAERFLRDEFAKWGTVVRGAGVKPN